MISGFCHPLLFLRSLFLTSPIASLDNSSDRTARSAIALFPHKKDRLAIASSLHAKGDRILTSYQMRSHAHLIPDAIASPHPAKRERIQQLHQQIEAWEALLEKLGGSE
jgi:Zn-dependent protease with chaperone function